jgi:sec-independent protein translocase protein TatA
MSISMTTMSSSLLETSLPMAWGLGGQELVFIFLIILLLFGAKKLPELARSLGQAKKEFGKATKETMDEIDRLSKLPPSENGNGNHKDSKKV